MKIKIVLLTALLLSITSFGFAQSKAASSAKTVKRFAQTSFEGRSLTGIKQDFKAVAVRVQ